MLNRFILEAMVLSAILGFTIGGTGVALYYHKHAVEAGCGTYRIDQRNGHPRFFWNTKEEAK